MFLNQLNQMARDFDSALEPYTEWSAEGVHGIIKLMEATAGTLRRRTAE